MIICQQVVINSNMENMQDILKKYYASGGKDLFKEKLTEIDDTDSSGLKTICIILFEDLKSTNITPP